MLTVVPMHSFETVTRTLTGVGGRRKVRKFTVLPELRTSWGRQVERLVTFGLVCLVFCAADSHDASHTASPHYMLIGM